ncbi:unnamed protein product [Paramecium octaurelia]|uniref:C3H1-type domain-containing protein n=1 Tax=Paramecium octaurelia TaxID=43137 RepID=A0A8S1SXU4_PAROT|nr:unnamed protein product [Paramecium octaurelia]
MNQQISCDEFDSNHSTKSCESNSDEQLDEVMPTQKNNKKVSYKVKVKTEICKYWAIEGYCPYGQQCAFAHGKDEVRQKVHVPSNYKTKTCKNYTQDGYCCYGERCQFKHPEKKTNKLPTVPYQILLANINLLFASKSKLQKRSKGLPKLIKDVNTSK